MELRPELILTTVIKSLGDNVIPAIDPDNAPARQQAQLSIALLEILKSRLPLMYRYDRHDLKSFVELGKLLPPAVRIKKRPGISSAYAAKRVNCWAEREPIRVKCLSNRRICGERSASMSMMCAKRVTSTPR